MATIGFVTLAIGNVFSRRSGSLAAASARPTVTMRVSSPTRTKVITPVTVPSDSKVIRSRRTRSTSLIADPSPGAGDGCRAGSPPQLAPAMSATAASSTQMRRLSNGTRAGHIVRIAGRGLEKPAARLIGPGQRTSCP